MTHYWHLKENSYQPLWGAFWNFPVFMSSEVWVKSEYSFNITSNLYCLHQSVCNRGGGVLHEHANELFWDVYHTHTRVYDSVHMMVNSHNTELLVDIDTSGATYCMYIVIVM